MTIRPIRLHSGRKVTISLHLCLKQIFTSLDSQFCNNKKFIVRSTLVFIILCMGVTAKYSHFMCSRIRLIL